MDLKSVAYKTLVRPQLDLKSLMRYDFIHIDFFLLIILMFFLTNSILPLKYFFFFCYLCLSQHKLKFWTGIRQKIRCGMVLVGMDS